MCIHTHIYIYYIYNYIYIYVCIRVLYDVQCIRSVSFILLTCPYLVRPRCGYAASHSPVSVCLQQKAATRFAAPIRSRRNVTLTPPHSTLICCTWGVVDMLHLIYPDFTMIGSIYRAPISQLEVATVVLKRANPNCTNEVFFEPEAYEASRRDDWGLDERSRDDMALHNLKWNMLETCSNLLETSWNLVRECQIILNSLSMLKRICHHLCQDSACKVDCQEYGHAENTLLCPWYLWLQSIREISQWLPEQSQVVGGLQLGKQFSMCTLVVVRHTQAAWPGAWCWMVLACRGPALTTLDQIIEEVWWEMQHSDRSCNLYQNNQAPSDSSQVVDSDSQICLLESLPRAF